MSRTYIYLPRGISGLPARWKSFGDDAGSALVELVIVVAFLAVPLLLGTSQMAILIYDSIAVSNAAFAGASYGMRSVTYASNSAGITTAAQGEASNFGTALAVTSSIYYACASAIGGTQYTGTNAQSNATAACTGSSNHALEFLQVRTSALVTSMIHCPGLPASYTLTGSSIMEIEQ